MPRFEKLRINLDGWTDWIQPVSQEHEGKLYRRGCCDCGLVHDVDVRVFEGRVQWRMRRNNRSTTALRRSALAQAESK